jgi:antitoxin ParD1/3/4
MATMNVSLPDEMKAWVEDEARSGRYANASDYVRDLIRRDHERKTFRRLIEEGLASGVSERRAEDLLAEARRRAAARDAL